VRCPLQITLTRDEFAAVLWDVYTCGMKTKVKLPALPNLVNRPEDHASIESMVLMFRSYASEKERQKFKTMASVMLAKRAKEAA